MKDCGSSSSSSRRRRRRRARRVSRERVWAVVVVLVAGVVLLVAGGGGIVRAVGGFHKQSAARPPSRWHAHGGKSARPVPHMRKREMPPSLGAGATKMSSWMADENGGNAKQPLGRPSAPLGDAQYRTTASARSSASLQHRPGRRSRVDEDAFAVRGSSRSFSSRSSNGTSVIAAPAATGRGSRGGREASYGESELDVASDSARGRERQKPKRSWAQKVFGNLYPFGGGRGGDVDMDSEDREQVARRRPSRWQSGMSRSSKRSSADTDGIATGPARYDPFRVQSQWTLRGVKAPHVPTKAVKEIVPTKQEKRWQNIVLVKVFKCMSSSVGGVVRRIGLYAGMHGISTNIWTSTEPMIWANHMRRASLQSKIRELERPTFVFTTVREPAGRCLSHMYFGVHPQLARRSLDKDGVVQVALDKKYRALRKCSNMMTGYIHPNGVSTDAQGAFDAYDFIGSAERPDETYVLLYYLLRHTPVKATIYDMLFVASKNTSQTQEFGVSKKLLKDLKATTRFPAGQPPHPHLENEPKEILDYIKRNFADRNVQDISLVHMVHLRMDQMIASIPDFAETLAFYRKLQLEVRSQCGTMAPPCIYKDAGCSQDCIYAVARDNGDTRAKVETPPFEVQQSSTRRRRPVSRIRTIRRHRAPRRPARGRGDDYRGGDDDSDQSRGFLSWLFGGRRHRG